MWNNAGFSVLDLIFFLFFIYLSKLYTQWGAGTHDPKIKSHMFFLLSQADTPDVYIFEGPVLGQWW